MKQLVKRAILPAPGPRCLPSGIGRGLRMHIDFAHQTRTYLGLYEIELNRYLRRILKPGCTAFDVGARDGYDSLVIAGLTGSRVAAFDCEPTSVRLMERNFRLNPDLAGRLEPVEAAVGDDTEQTGIDEYAHSEAGFVPDFLKIDVDGGELGVLRSACRLLAEHSPALIVETHSAELERACGRLLTEFGYRPVVVNQRLFLPDHRPTTNLNRWLVAT
jgi:Methyltransferase FkbM domain